MSYALHRLVATASIILISISAAIYLYGQQLVHNSYICLIGQPYNINHTSAANNQHNTDTIQSNRPYVNTLSTDQNGYVAVLYSGTARAFSQCYASHLVNLIASSPYTVHIFIHTYTNDNKFRLVHDSLWSNYRTINSTLNYYVSYIDLYGNTVHSHDMIKGYAEQYYPVEQLMLEYGNEWNLTYLSQPNGPTSDILSMWNSQRQVDELRRSYQHQHNIDYKWVFRLRFDSIIMNNFWEHVFTVQPYNYHNLTHQQYKYNSPDQLELQPVVIADMIYHPRLQSNQLYVPNCRHWNGANDQFAASNSTIATLYNTRIKYIQRMFDESIVHPETSIKLMMEWNNIRISYDANMCYSIVRVNPIGQSSSTGTVEYNSTTHRSLVEHSHTTCAYKFTDSECCNSVCGIQKQRSDRLNEVFNQYISYPTDNTILPDIQPYIDHVCINDNNCNRFTSSYYYFYRYVNSLYYTTCLPSTWPIDTQNVYRFQYIPFIHTADGAPQADYMQHLVCQI